VYSSELQQHKSQWLKTRTIVLLLSVTALRRNSPSTCHETVEGQASSEGCACFPQVSVVDSDSWPDLCSVRQWKTCLHESSMRSLGFLTAWRLKFPKEPDRSCMVFSNPISEVTQCHFYCILTEEAVTKTHLILFLGKDKRRLHLMMGGMLNNLQKCF
jgi:hypothetical protein